MSTVINNFSRLLKINLLELSIHKRVATSSRSINKNKGKELDQHYFKQQVYWKDLLDYKTGETIKELLLPLPWLFLALWSSYQSTNWIEDQLYWQFSNWTVVSIIASFYFFLTGLRVTHNAFHYCLGLSRWATDIVMFILSGLMLGSLHAIQYTHLQHHRDCLGRDDIEGSVSKQGFWEAIIKGPLFPFRIHREALKRANKKAKCWIVAELSMNIVWITSVWFWFEVDVFVIALRIHIFLMVVAYALSAFFAVWTVHHDSENKQGETAHWDNSRTMRSKWKSILFYNMFYHIEHHLFPQIPTCHLPELAKRLDLAGYHTHKSVI